MIDGQILGLSGTPTVRVDTDDDNASATSPGYPAQQTLPSGPLLKAQPNAGPDVTWRGATLTALPIGNAIQDGFFSTHPTGVVGQQVITAVDGQRFGYGGVDSELTAEAFIGGEAEVFRMVSGAMQRVRKSAIVGGDLSSKLRIGLSDATGYPQSAGFYLGLANWYRAEGHTYHLGVAAVDAGGQIGAIGWTTFSAPTAWSGNFTPPANTEIALGQAYTEGGPLAAPANVVATRTEGVVHLTWDAVSGAMAYIPFVSWNTDPATHPAFTYFELEADGGAAMQPGDLVFWRSRVWDPRPTMHSARFWGIPFPPVDQNLASGLSRNRGPYSYRYNTFGGGDPSPNPETAGSAYLRLTVPPGQSINHHGRFWHGAPNMGLPVLEVGKTYQIQCWMRANRATTTTVSWTLDLGGEGTTAVSLTTSWQLVTLSGTLTTALIGTTVRAWRLWINTTGEASDLIVDFAGGMCPHESGVTYQAPTATDLAVAPPGTMLRDHLPVKFTGRSAPDSGDLTEPPGCSSRVSTVDSFMRYCEAGSYLPWVQAEWHIGLDGWLDLAAYLAAPVSSGHPMALKRQAQGREAPWTDAFGTFFVEVGNEAWNPGADFWTFSFGLTDSVTAETYSGADGFGALVSLYLDQITAQSWWPSDVEFVFGGWNKQDWSDDLAAATSDHPGFITVAAYNLGWDTGTALKPAPLAADLARILEFPLADDRYTADLLNAGKGVHEAGDYEAGPGYQLNGLNGLTMNAAEGILQEITMKSLGAASATLDAFLYRAQRGWAFGNFFNFASGSLWTTHAGPEHGGGVYPTWQILREVNTLIGAGGASVGPAAVITGNELAFDNYLGDPITGNAIWAYMLTPLDHPNRRILAVGNRSATDTIKPTILTSIASATSARSFGALGSMYAHNRYAPGKRLASAPTVFGAGQTGTTINVESFSWVPQLGEVHTFDGVSGSYTVASVTGFDKTVDDRADRGGITYTGALASSPADGAPLTSDAVDPDGYVPDATCIALDLAAQVISVPPDLNRIVIDNSVGAGASGLAPGQSVVLILEGFSKGVA